MEQGSTDHTVSAFSVVRTLCVRRAPQSESGTPCAHPPAARPSDRGRSGWMEREGGACRGPHELSEARAQLPPAVPAATGGGVPPS